MNSKEYWGLAEAYSEVYAPQKEFQLWVNSLLDEGYDLSDYTWEDMYEVYVNEDIKSFADKGGIFGALGRAISRSGTDAGKAQNRAAVSRTVGNINRSITNTMRTGGLAGKLGRAIERGKTDAGKAQNRAALLGQKPTPKPTPTPTPTNTRKPLDPGRFERERERLKNVGNPPTTPTPSPTPTPRPRPTTPTPKPAASAPAARPASAPAASKPAPTPTTSTSTTSAAPKRTFNPLMQRTFGYQTGYAPDQVKKDPKKMAQMGSLKNISSGLDMFDLVKGHLLDEGYADTEDAAMAIMANMSEEWRNSILNNI